MASAPFVMNVSGTGALKFSLTEINILLLSISMLSKLFLTRRLVSIGKLAAPVALYLAIAAISSVQGGIVYADIIALLQTAIFCFLCPLLAINAALTPQHYRNLMLAYAVACVSLAALQLLGGIGNQVFGINKNNMGQNLATGLVVWICLWMDSVRGWWSRFTVPAMLVTLLGLFITLSRGAWVGAVVGLVVIALLNRRFVFLARVLALAVPVIALMWSYLPDDSKAYAAGLDSKTNRNIAARYNSRDLALAAFKQNPVIGVGVSLRKQMDATNLVFVTLGESGLLGLLSFITIQSLYVVVVVRLVKTIPRTDPRYLLLIVSPTLMAVRLAHGQFDHYWVRGATTMAWVSVGVVLAIAADEKRRVHLLRSRRPLVATHSVLESGNL
jgi:O-antigen ligase